MVLTTCWNDPGAQFVADALDELITSVQDACVRYSVTFWETDIGENGGKIMLVAGAPNSTDDDTGNLLSTVREVLDGSRELQVRAGVNHGRVFAGGFGPPYRRTYSAKGDAVNLAARLMGRAGPDEALVSNLALLRSRVRFSAVELEPFLVKGKAEPVNAHRLGARQLGVRVRRSGGPPLLGRDDEIVLLTARVEAALAGHGSCVEVTGAPGIGKTRFIDEVERLAGSIPVVSVVCGTNSAPSCPTPPCAPLFRQALRQAVDASPQSVGEALTATVRRVGPHLLPWLPLIGTVLGAEVALTAETNALDERFRRARLEEVVIEFLSLLLPGPALLVLDDAQWMDEAKRGPGRAADRPDRGLLPWLLIVGRGMKGGGLRID